MYYISIYQSDLQLFFADQLILSFFFLTSGRMNERTNEEERMNWVEG